MKYSYILPLVAIFTLASCTNSDGAKTSLSISTNEVTMSLSGEDSYQEVNEVVLQEDYGTCDEEYSTLLSKYANDYSGCFMQRENIPSCEQARTSASKVNIVVVIDTSGSMGEKIGNETMMDMAKEQLSEYLSSLDSDTRRAVIVYGHKGNNSKAGRELSCNSIDVLAGFDDSDVTVKSRVAELKPNGWTPIDRSLRKAQELVKEGAGANDRNIILLVSDGKETCDGNPAAVAKEIASTPNTYVDVIGFNVLGEAQKQLIEIAKNGGGKYTDVRSRADFENAFQHTKNFLNAMSCGASKASLELNLAMEGINRYHSCLYMLKEEETKIITNISQSCGDTASRELDLRERMMSAKLEAIMQESDRVLGSFDKHMDMVKDEF